MTQDIKKPHLLKRRVFTHPLSPLYFVTTARKMVSGNFTLTKMNYGIVSSFFQSLKPNVVRTPVGRIKESQAAFRFALDYYGYETTADLTRQRRWQFALMCWFGTLLIAYLTYGTYVFMNGGSGINLLYDILHCYVLTPILVIYTVKFAFMYSQIKHRRLFSFWHWLANPFITFAAPQEVTLKDHEYEYYLENALIIPRRNILSLPNFA